MLAVLLVPLVLLCALDTLAGALPHDGSSSNMLCQVRRCSAARAAVVEHGQPVHGPVQHVLRLCAVQAGTMLVVFGGQLVRDGSISADVYWLNLERMEWHKQPCRWAAAAPEAAAQATSQDDLLLLHDCMDGAAEQARTASR